MANILPSVTESDVMTALRSVILSIVDCEIVQAQQNRVPMPTGEFIALTPGSMMALSTSINSHTATERTILRPTQTTVQVDCYGPKSQERALAISMILRNSYGADQFAALGYDVQTLYAGDAKQIPLVNGEEQFEQRYTFEAVLQINPTLTVPQESANALTVDLINVDAIYPPGA